MPDLRTVTVVAATVALRLVSGGPTAQAQTQVAQIPEPGPRAGGWVELAVHAGAGTLAGPLGVSVAALPMPGLALGVLLGWAGYPDVGIDRHDARLALFARGYVLDRPRFRVSVGLAGASVDDGVAHPGKTDDGRAVTVYRAWGGAGRVDGSVGLELVRGNLALGLQVGVGRVFGGSSCLASRDGFVTQCAGDPSEGIPVVRDSTSPWRPFAGVSVAVRPGGQATAGIVQPATAVGAGQVAERRGSLDGLLAGATARGTDVINDGHYTDHPDFDAGLAVQYLLRLGTGGWRVGAGARYGIGAGRAYGGVWEYEHVLTLPLLVGWAWRSAATGEELEILGGAGPGFMFLSYGTDVGTSPAKGIAVELGFNYVRPLTSRLAVVFGVAVGAQTVEVDGPAEAYLDGASGFHGEIPVRVGLRYRL